MNVTCHGDGIMVEMANGQQTPNQPCYITNKMTGKVLDVEYCEAKDGNPVIMWEKKSPPANNQLWTFEPCEGYYHVVTCLDPNLVLTVKENPNTCGYYATVCEKMSPPNPCQLFQWCEDHLTSLMGENFCIDVDCAKTCDGALVVVGLISGLVSQHWHVEQQPDTCCPTEITAKPEPPPCQLPPRGFHIENTAVDRVFTVANGQATQGNHVVSAPKSNPPSSDQLWRLEDAGNGYYFMISELNPNMVLDVEQGNPNAVGQHLIIWQKKLPPEANQLFRWQGNMLESALNTNLVLDIEQPWDGYGSKIVTADVGEEGEHSKNWTWTPVW